MDLDSVAEELYALPPEEFTAARDAATKQAGEAGLKKAIKSLRRPTTSAHAVNQIVRTRPGEVDELLGLGDELRGAMAGQGGDVRRLTEQRRTAISGLIPPDLPAAVRDDVTATLEAATADPQLAEAVRSGRLVKPLRYAGFGEFPDLADFVATPLTRPARAAKKMSAKKSAAQKTATEKTATEETATKKTPAKKAAAAAAEADLAALRQRVLELSGAADDAQRRYDIAGRAVVEARAQLEQAEKERADAHRAARAAHAEAERARRELGRRERS